METPHTIFLSSVYRLENKIENKIIKDEMENDSEVIGSKIEGCVEIEVEGEIMRLKVM